MGDEQRYRQVYCLLLLDFQIATKYRYTKTKKGPRKGKKSRPVPPRLDRLGDVYAAGLGLGRQPARVRGPDAADQLVLRVAAPELAALLLLQELGRRGLDARRRVGRALRVRRHVRRELVALVLLRVVARLFGGQFLRDDAEEGWRMTRLLVMIGRFNLDENEGRTQLRAKKKKKRTG